MTRTFGIEEEFFLVDPETSVPIPMSDELSSQLLGQELDGTTVPPIRLSSLSCSVLIIRLSSCVA